jgi:hypothetical protein
MPKWGLEKAIENIALWQRAYQVQADMHQISLQQIKEYQQ